MFDIEKIRADFPILSRKVYGVPLVYLDSGATAQKPLCVIDKVNELHRETNANIHRGVHFLSEQSTEMYEMARERVRTFIRAGAKEQIIFTSGATASINLVAQSFGEAFIGRGDNVVVSQMEHHSNIVPWQLICERKGAQIKVLPFKDNGELDIETLSSLVDGRTRMVAITQASNVLGTCPDIAKVVAIAHKAGARVLVDGCQGVVHGGVDVAAMGCDFYAFSGHKLYAPTGIGVLYGKMELLESMPPYMGGGDMVARVSFGKTTYADLPFKFEAGTANFIGAIALAEAIDYVEKLGAQNIAAHEHALLVAATQRLSKIEGLRIYGTTPTKCPIISFNVEGVHPYDIGMIVDKMGVAIRTGTHCAEPVMTRYGVEAMARASFGLYNNMEDVEKLEEATIKAVKMLRR